MTTVIYPSISSAQRMSIYFATSVLWAYVNVNVDVIGCIQRMMRAFVPNNISSTTLRAMIADGVPPELAQRIWDKKILWLICMHPLDLPRVSPFFPSLLFTARTELN
jgi:hypothetical protein